MTVGLTRPVTGGTARWPTQGTIVLTRRPVKHVRSALEHQAVTSPLWPMLKWLLLIVVNFKLLIQRKVVSVIMQLHFPELADLAVLLIQRQDSNLFSCKLNLENDSEPPNRSILEALENLWAKSLNPTKGWNTFQDLCLWYFIQANNLSDNKFDNIKIWNRLVLCRMCYLGRRQRYPKIQWNNYG